MSTPRVRRPVRPSRPVGALLAVAAALAAAGCGEQGELHSDGPTPEASAPARLWPGATPSRPPASGGGGPGVDGPVPVDGLVRMPPGELRRADPLDVLRRDVAADPAVAGGPDAWDADTVARIASCHRDCPVRPAAYQDLTGDGEAELIMGVDLPEGMVALRVYTVVDGRVTRVLATVQASPVVEVSDQQLMLRSPAEARGYESVTVYGWEGEDAGMVYLGNLLLARDGGGDPDPAAFRPLSGGGQPSGGYGASGGPGPSAGATAAAAPAAPAARTGTAAR